MTADFKKSNLLSPHEEASLASGRILQNLEVASPPLFPLLGVLDVPEKTKYKASDKILYT